jgi:hypothetical protein
MFTDADFPGVEIGFADKTALHVLAEPRLHHGAHILQLEDGQSAFAPKMAGRGLPVIEALGPRGDRRGACRRNFFERRISNLRAATIRSSD